MSTFRSRRLLQVFGSELSEITHVDVERLVANGITEAADLDFKEELYGRNDAAKRDVCGDVAALANSGGGVIVLGVKEDGMARAAEAPGVELSDDEARRIRSIVADGVSPLPRFDVVPVEGPAPGRGFLLIAVPPSPMAPHGVAVNSGWRYPRRHGTGTIYLSEAQVSGAYLDRAAGQRERAGRAAALETALVDTLDASQVFVVVTLIPDIGGSFILDTGSYREFRNTTLWQDPRIIKPGNPWARASVRSGRLAADGGDPRVGPGGQWVACELGQDGSGAFAAAVGRLDGSGPAVVVDEYLVDGVLSGLRFLARHARDRAVTGGGAVIRASVWPLTAQTPAQLVHERGHNDATFPPPVAVSPTVEAVVVLDDVAEDGPDLVAAAHPVLTGLAHGFGMPEIWQLSADGQMRDWYWSEYARPTLRTWAAAAGVTVTAERIM